MTNAAHMQTKCELTSELEIDCPLGEFSLSDRVDLYCRCLQYLQFILCRPVQIVKHILYNQAINNVHFHRQSKHFNSEYTFWSVPGDSKF